MFYFYAHFLKWNEREFIKNFYIKNLKWKRRKNKIFKKTKLNKKKFPG